MEETNTSNDRANDDNVLRATINDRDIVIDKRDETAILTEDCKRIMRNLCKMEVGPADFTATTADLTQPSFLNQEEKELFFKMKMFYLLQERFCYLNSETDKDNGKDMHLAEAYPLFLSPFGEPAAAGEEPPKPKKKRRRKKRPESMIAGEDETDSEIRGGKNPSAKMRGPDSVVKTGLSKFSENVRKADQSVFRTFEEKLMKTSEGKGFSALLPPEMTNMDMQMSMFPDNQRLMADGKDEESKLNNLVVHVRNRLKIFEKMQTFYENSKEDNVACMFTVPNSDFTEMRDELVDLRPRRWHNMDAKKLKKLFECYKDDYSAAKTTLIADGTQPIVLNRKKVEHIKRYIDDFADLKTLKIPYHREMNFFFMTVPWTKTKDDEKPKSAELDGPHDD